MDNLVFKLYYNEDDGSVITYTCGEHHEGSYIKIDKLTFIEARYDVRVIDGKVKRQGDLSVCPIMEVGDDGYPCSPDDMSIVVSEDEPNNKWKLTWKTL